MYAELSSNCARSTVKFDIDTVSAHSSYPSLPKVDIHYAMREFDGQLVLDSLKNGADGVVIAGTGSGSVVTGTAGTLEAMEEGLIVAVSTRSPNGGERGSSLESDSIEFRAA